MISIKQGQLWKFSNGKGSEAHFCVVECKLKEIKVCELHSGKEEEHWIPRYEFHNSDCAELVSDVG
jgi:hypothetical protein